jgi:regulator of cell morphogenesis and NO signaling
VTTHHEYLKTELPLLHQRVNKVAQVHGGRDASLLEVAQLYGGLRAELEMHLRKEEMILFPAIERYESALENGLPLPRMPFGSLANPIAMMESEHSGAGNALERMRELTDAWQPPSHACATYRAMLSGLQELERDLHTHIHLENNILFPRAIQLEN